MAKRRQYYHDPMAPAATSLSPSVFVVIRSDPHPDANLMPNDEGSRILLVRRVDDGNWELPGGRVDLGESVTTAAEREVTEESGIRIAVTRLAGVYSDPDHILVYPTGEARQQFALCVHATYLDGDPHPDDHETCEAAWVPITEVPCLPIHPTMRGRITDALGEPTRAHLR